MPDVEAILRGWENPIDPRYFTGDTRFSLAHGDYAVRGLLGHEPDLDRDVMFDGAHTSYGLVLQAPRKAKVLDTAVCGFNADDSVLDCLQLQGGARRYRELTPVRWEGALLGDLIELGRATGHDAVLLVPSFIAKGWTPENAERLKKLYDDNAARHRMPFSDEMQRYVLELN